jgi:multimeric flavodoxin WrbA
VKICVIHGSQRKGNTEKTIEIVKAKLNSLENNDYFDFYLPKDLPSFCCGCFQCLDKGSSGGECCPHAKYTHPILEAMKLSNGIIIASPVYSLAESGQVKTFLDHFGCIYMSHRPLQEMFSKTGFVISTTAGAGTTYVIKPIKRNLRYWGIPKIYKCGLTLSAKNWSDMPSEKQSKYEECLGQKAHAFYNSMKNKRVYIPLITKIMFSIFRNLMNSYSDGHQDKEYWRDKGWLQGKRPW